MEKTITDERLEKIDGIGENIIYYKDTREAVEILLQVMDEMVEVCRELNNRVKLLENMHPTDQRLLDQLNN